MTNARTNWYSLASTSPTNFSASSPLTHIDVKPWDVVVEEAPWSMTLHTLLKDRMVSNVLIRLRKPTDSQWWCCM